MKIVYKYWKGERELLYSGLGYISLRDFTPDDGSSNGKCKMKWKETETTCWLILIRWQRKSEEADRWDMMGSQAGALRRLYLIGVVARHLDINAMSNC